MIQDWGTSKVEAVSLATSITNEDINLWYRRLAHVSSSALNNILAVEHTRIGKVLNNCSICPYAKQVRPKFLVSTTRISVAIELIHVDVWSPYKTPTFDGHKYFLTIVDNMIRITWIVLLRLKSDVCVALESYFTLVRNQFNSFIKTIKTSNGTEFLNSTCDAYSRVLGSFTKRLLSIYHRRIVLQK